MRDPSVYDVLTHPDSFSGKAIFSKKVGVALSNTDFFYENCTFISIKNSN
jgi:hypothetical protein